MNFLVEHKMERMNKKGLSTFETIAVVLLVILVVLIVVDSSSTGAGVVKSFFANFIPEKLGILPKESTFQIEEGPGIVMYNLLDDSVNYRKDKVWNSLEGNLDLGDFTVNKDQLYADFSSYWYAQQLRDSILEGQNLRIAPVGSTDFTSLPKLTDRPEIVKGPDSFNGVNSKLSSYVKVDYGVVENKRTYFMSFDKKLYQRFDQGLIFFSIKDGVYQDNSISEETKSNLAKISTFGSRGIDLLSNLEKDISLPGEEFILRYLTKNDGTYSYAFYKGSELTNIDLDFKIKSQDSISVTYSISVRVYNDQNEINVAYTESAKTSKNYLSDKLTLSDVQKNAFINALVDWRDYIVKKPVQLNYQEISGIPTSNYFCVVYIKDKGMLAVDLRKPVDVNKECV